MMKSEKSNTNPLYQRNPEVFDEAELQEVVVAMLDDTDREMLNNTLGLSTNASHGDQFNYVSIPQTKMELNSKDGDEEEIIEDIETVPVPCDDFSHIDFAQFDQPEVCEERHESLPEHAVKVRDLSELLNSDQHLKFTSDITRSSPVKAQMLPRNNKPNRSRCESDEIQEMDISDEEWKSSQVGGPRSKRKLSQPSSNNKIIKNSLPSASSQQTRYSPYRKEAPPPLQPILGKTPCLIIKPLRIPPLALSNTFIVRQHGNSRIQLIPKRKENLNVKLTNTELLAQRKMSRPISTALRRTRTRNPPKKYSPASSTINSTLFDSEDESKIPQAPKADLQYCANCNLKFTKTKPKISHFRLNGERLSATDAFKKIFQLQQSKKVFNINMNESAGLCSPCGQLIAKIYGAVYNFTQKRSTRSYFHQVTAHTLKNVRSNGTIDDTNDFGAKRKRSVQVGTDPPEKLDKWTSFPVEDPIPYVPHVPVMPVKLEDYSRVTALCEICGAGLTKESGLRTHLLLTHSISTEEKLKDFVCGLCGKAYFFQYLLKNHMSVHSDDKPFSCPKENCDAKFKSRASLRTHRIEVHELREQGQSFDCQFCNKKYLRPRDLRDHTIARHSEKPMFECQYCKKSFQRKKNVRTHKCLNRPTDVDLKPIIVSSLPPLPRERVTKVKKTSTKPSVPSSQVREEEVSALLNNNASFKKPDVPPTPHEIVQSLVSMPNSYHQPPEPVQHVEIQMQGSLVRPTQHIQQSMPIHILTPHRPQVPTLQYSVQQPINFTHVIQPSQHQQQQQLLHTLQQSHHPQIQHYRLQTVGPHHVIQQEGEQINVYESVNFLDIFNESRQQQQVANNTASTPPGIVYQNLSFAK